MLSLQLQTIHAEFCQMRLLRACLAEFFLPLCRQCLVTTSLDSLVMVRWVELPYNHVSRDVGHVFFYPEYLAVLAHANEIHYYQNYWNAWQQ